MPKTIFYVICFIRPADYYENKIFPAEPQLHAATPWCTDNSVCEEKERETKRDYSKSGNIMIYNFLSNFTFPF